MKKIFLFAGLSIMFLGAGCLRRGVEPPSAPKPFAPAETMTTEKPLAYLRLNGGTATVARADAWENAEDGTELVSGDHVKAVSGQVFVVYPDAGATRLDTGTEVEILAPDEAAGLVTQIRVVAGNVWTRLERLLGREEHFSVVAGGVVATVRGTAFGVSLEGDDVDVQVADHEVEITDEEEDIAATSADVKREPLKKRLRLAAGQGFRMKRDAFRAATTERLKSALRKLGDFERRHPGFQFSAKRLTLDHIKKPQIIRRLKLPGRLTPELLQRIERLRQLKSLWQELQPIKPL